LTHALGGGVWSTTRFLETILRNSGGYVPAVFVVSTSATDSASVRLGSPVTWLKGYRVREGTADGVPYQHVGAVLTEFEFQRYQPRRALTDLLNRYDLIQVVAGTPAWAHVTRLVQPPVCL